MSNVITKLRAKKTDINSPEEIIPIGVYSDNVIISDENNKVNLTQVYNYLKTFFNNKVFSWYGTNCPNNDNIINFYQIEEN